MPRTNSPHGAMPEREITPEREIAALITRLMSHYWLADEHPAVREAQVDDWLEDLIEFPPAVVEAACKEWRQTMPRRPTPAELIPRCFEEQRRLNDRLAIKDDRVPSVEDFEKLADAWARSNGFLSVQEMQLRGRSLAVKIGRYHHRFEGLPAPARVEPAVELEPKPA